MQPFQIKTIVLKKCRRCGTHWSVENIKLESCDQINITIVTIAYCPACSEGMSEEIDRPTYERRGKKIRGK